MQTCNSNIKIKNKEKIEFTGGDLSKTGREVSQKARDWATYQREAIGTS